jgi:hypothetical protein
MITRSPAMTDPRTLADRYLATWNEPDAARRGELLAALWAPDGRYADPLMAGTGPAHIGTLIEAARAQFAGLAFSLRGTPDGHGDFARFSWALGPAGGAAIAGGTDVARVDADGRLAEVVGFIDFAPAAA